MQQCNFNQPRITLYLHSAAKRTLRKRLWFPGMDDMIDTRTKTCEPCQPATIVHTRDPLKPTTAPETPFVKVAADHWGPTPDGKHLLVVIDLLSRFPEVAVVKGTSAEANIQALDDIFSRHFSPQLFLTDNGPPFNTEPSHPLQVYFKKMGITHRPTIAAEDPEANGTVEAFMKHLKKVWHTSIAQHRDPILDLNRHLRSFRSTPHPTTGHIPAEILFGRKVRTIIPDLRPDPAQERADIIDARAKDKASKERMKEYKDKPANVRTHNIFIGDKVLLRQKSTKSNPPHDPDPYTVTDVQGTQITAVRHGRYKTRDSQRFKKVATPQPPRFRNLPASLQDHRQLSIRRFMHRTIISFVQPHPNSIQNKNNTILCDTAPGNLVFSFFLHRFFLVGSSSFLSCCFFTSSSFLLRLFIISSVLWFL